MHTPPSHRDNRYFWLVLLLMLAGALARIYGLGEWGYSFDEIWHVYVAQQKTPADIVYADLHVDGHPILPYLLWHWLLKIWDDPWMARLPSLVAGIACIPLGYWAGKEIFTTKNGGLFTAFFITFSPLMIEQSGVVRGYVLMMAFTLIALWSVYRYRSAPELKYILLYFISATGAFLSEFSAIPLITFAALHLLYSIYKKPAHRLLPFLLFVLIHLTLLAYLLVFLQALDIVSSQDLTHQVFFEPNDTMLTELARIVIYLCSFVSDNNLLLYGGIVTGSTVFAAGTFMLFLLACCVGLYQLVRTRQVHLLLVIAVPLVITIAFNHLDKITIDVTRRMIGLIIPMIVVLYETMLYWRPKRSVSSTIVIPVVTICLCLGYAAFGTQWRNQRTDEFQITRNQTHDVFVFMHEHVTPHDIIVTDWEGYYQFWKNAAPREVKFISPQLSYYDGFTAPVYIITEDLRSSIFLMMPRTFQHAMQQLNTLGLLAGKQKAWLFNINYIDGVLNPQFASYTLLRRFSKAQQLQYKKELDSMIGEQENFARYAYVSAAPKKVGYTYPCARDTDIVRVGKENNNCPLNFFILALPVSDIYTRIINHPPFGDPVTLLYRANGLAP